MRPPIKELIAMKSIKKELRRILKRIHSSKNEYNIISGGIVFIGKNEKVNQCFKSIKEMVKDLTVK